MAVLPKTSFSRRLERLWTGLVEASSVRLPCLAAHRAAAPAMTVLPTPPLPPKKMYLSFGCSCMKRVMLTVIGFIAVLLPFTARRTC